MPLSHLPEMLADAHSQRYALGYFESWNLESLQGVLDAAQAARSPVIIGFNGEFLCSPKRRTAENVALYAALGRAAAAAATVPCALIFNECSVDGAIGEAIEAGFSIVMPADESAPYADYERRVAKIASLAHARGVAVEAEVGCLPSGVDAGHGGAPTDPELAERFVAATAVDLLAVSVGNVHIKLEGQQRLDIDLLGRIRARVQTPLVLHGGTGIDAQSLREAVAMGVAKVNYGTYLKQRYLNAVRTALGSREPNPHELLGIGGPGDAMVAGRLAVRDAVLERLPILGSCGRA